VNIVVDNQTNNKKILKEILSRAKKEEKQAYNILSNKQLAVFDSFSELVRVYSKISDTRDMDLCPKDPILGDKPVTEMSIPEFSDYMSRWNNYLIEYFKWSGRNISATNEQIAVIGDFIKELMNLINYEAEEKWLLLSIAIRSQPNLLNYIQRKEE
jgi:hypothetical protein